MTSQLKTLLPAVVASAAVGFGISSVTQPQAAQAGPTATSAAADSRIVQELRTLNRSVGSISDRYSVNGVAYKGFNDLYKAIVDSCHAQATDNRYECPSYSH